MNYRVLAVFLTAVMIITLSACGAGGGNEAAYQPEQSTSSHSVDTTENGTANTNTVL